MRLSTNEKVSDEVCAYRAACSNTNIKKFNIFICLRNNTSKPDTISDAVKRMLLLKGDQQFSWKNLSCKS